MRPMRGLPRDRMFLDPTVAEVRQKVGDDIARLRQWGST